jgi:hypothetical protein
MARLRCSDYGFECDFVSEGEVEAVIKEFGTTEILDFSKKFSLFQITKFYGEL